MNNALDLVLLQDLMRLPRETLEEIAVDLGIGTNTTVQDISHLLWLQMQANRDLRQSALARIDDKILGGKTSVTWYTLDSGATLLGGRDILNGNLGFDPFNTFTIPNPDTLTNQPVIIGGCPGDVDRQYYLRLMYKSGVRTVFYGTESRVLPTTAVKTIFIDENTNLIEIRTDSRSANKFARYYASLIGQQITLSQRDILAPYGYDIERIADLLGGELIDATARPEVMLESLDEENVTAIFNILSALNGYFETGDNDIITRCLQESRDAFNEANLISIPFTALILCGLEKIGMGASGRDLRELPIYNYLRPHIQNQGGFIQFRVAEDGVNNTYTIRVGLETKSVYFMSPASETAIRFVRDHLI